MRVDLLPLGPLRVWTDALRTLEEWARAIPQRFLPRWKVSPIYSSQCSAGAGQFVRVDSTVADVPVKLEPSGDDNKGLPVRVKIVAGTNDAIVSVAGNGKLNGTAGATATVASYAEFVSCGSETGWWSC